MIMDFRYRYKQHTSMINNKLVNYATLENEKRFKDFAAIQSEYSTVLE